MSNPIVVVAKIVARPGKEDETRQALEALIAPTRAEEACIQYDLHRDQENPAAFLFYEIWTDKPSLDQHLNTPHLNKFKAKMDDLLGEPLDIKIYDKIR